MSIERTKLATVDIHRAVEELIDDCGPHVAELFLVRLEAMITRIASMPFVFSLVEPPFKHHPGLRVVPITKFTARLIFYNPTHAGILIVRVLLASGDWQAILDAAP